MEDGSKLSVLSGLAENFTTTHLTLPLFSAAGVIESLYTFVKRNQSGALTLGATSNNGTRKTGKTTYYGGT